VQKTYLILFQTIICILVVLLAISTFIPQQGEHRSHQYQVPMFFQLLHLDSFYTSWAHTILWSILILLLFSLLFHPFSISSTQSALHVSLAICLTLIIYDKSCNERYFVSLREGETCTLSINPRHNARSIQFTLLKFEIARYANQLTPKTFTSYLLIDNRDSIQVSVNQPLALGAYRLYQNAYENQVAFQVEFDSSTHLMMLGDTLRIHDNVFFLADYHQEVQKFELISSREQYFIPPGQTRRIKGHQIRIIPSGTIYTSILEVVEVRGLKLLLICSLIFIACLARTLWKRRHEH
jgi:hypothetical protein